MWPSAVFAWPGCTNPVGPDVIVGDMQAVANFTGDGTYDVFSFATYSCNIGNQGVTWVSSTNMHPVVGQNMFKYKNSGGYARFEQVGQSWLKHTFLALTDSLCCTCNGQGGSVLGTGCADPYTAGRNASQGDAGPKWQVNASNGVFTYPPANPAWSGSTARRLKCKVVDLESTAGGAGANVRFFGECQYVTQDDATAGNKNNNASYREVSMNGSGTAWSIANLASTQREKPGIRAWKAIDSSVTETDINVAGDGLFIVSSKATSLGGGIYHYEFAVQNLNSDRSGGSFSVPLPADANLSVTNIGFHDVDYHSGDGIGGVNFSGVDWPGVVSASAVTWSTENFNANANANALRWGTLYNFRFDVNLPPGNGLATIDFFKNTPLPNTVSGLAVVPQPDCNGNNVADATDIATATSQDLNGNLIPDECEVPVDPCHEADLNASNTIDIDDLVIVITNWGPCAGACPPYCLGDVNHECQVNIDDLVIIITEWGPCN
jgi:hypothetical protein